MKQGDLFSDTGAEPKPPKQRKKAEMPAPLPVGTPPKAAPSDMAQSDSAASPTASAPHDESTVSDTSPTATPSATPSATAASGDGVLGDAEQRRLSVTCFDRPILLAAGAGTGKTATLVARVVQWCLGPGWELEDDGERRPDAVAVRVLRGVSAITFTEAAAAEMATRVAQALACVQRVTAGAGEVRASELPLGVVPEELSDDPAVLFVRAQSLRAALEQLNVSTIHAFCRRLLAAHPLQIGFDPAFEVDATFSQIEIVLREVLEEFLRDAWSEPLDEDLIALARHGVGPPEIEQAIVDLVDAGARAEDFEADPLGSEVCSELLAELETSLRDVLTAALPLGSIKRNTELTLSALADSRAALAAREQSSPRAALEELRDSLAGVWSEQGARNKFKDWAKGKLTKGEAAALDEGADHFLAQAERCRAALLPIIELNIALLESSRRIVGRILGFVHLELRRRGVATFGDLLSGARRLLLENEPVAARERAGIQQLLVDEFQDTDGIQCDIVRVLGLEGDPETRPGLFLVGDPKQSIFAWRSADLEAFDSFAEFIEASGGMRLALVRNFRSSRGILDEVERSIANVMEEERGLQPPFAALEAARGNPDSDGTPAVEYWASWPFDPESGAIDPRGGRSGAASYEVEAQALARDIAKRRVAGEGAWSDFAVIFRALTGIEPYLEELRKLGIPYEVQGDRNYYRRREVVDVAALVRSVIDPYDHLALVTLLRSPSVGVPDAALLPLWEQGFPGAVSRLNEPDAERLSKLGELVAVAAKRVPGSIPGMAAIAGWESSLLAALAALAESRRSFRDDPADVWIETMRTWFPVEATESARFLGSYRLANQERFFRDLLHAMEERAGDVQSIVRTLRANLAREDRSEGARPSDSGQDAVRILTIHGSKGLEFKHVYLAQTHKGSGAPPKRQPTSFDRRGGTAAYELFGVSAPAWYETERRRAEAEAAERVRLLYVALTRAVDRLVVLGSFKVAPARKSWRKAGSMADLLEHRPRAEQALGELALRAARSDFEPWIDEWGTLWRLAAGGSGPRATDSAHAAEAESAATSTVIERESLELAACREASARRSARPFHTTASAEGHVESIETRAEQRFAEGEDEAASSRLASGTTLSARTESPSAIGRAAAQTAGTAVHRVLERFDLDADPVEEVQRWRELLPELCSDGVSQEHVIAATERALELLELVLGNGILARLRELSDHLVARELSVLLPVDHDVAGDDPSAPVGFVSGAIDLVYRDPEVNELVVADYKTDVIGDDAALEARVAAYAGQGRTYVEAVREALELDVTPRFELWFLRAGRIEVVPSR